jgi:hypothetical protein
VRSVRPYSPAASCPDIKVGDTLLSINGVNVTSLSSGNGGALPAVMVQLKKTPRVELLLLRKMGHKSNSRALGSSTVISDDEDDDGQPVLSGEVVGAVVVRIHAGKQLTSVTSVTAQMPYVLAQPLPSKVCSARTQATNKGGESGTVCSCLYESMPRPSLHSAFLPLLSLIPL